VRVAVVVTGSAGFLGRVLVGELVARGHQVVGVDRNPAAPGTPAHLVLTGDLLDRDEMVDAALDTADAVVHLAGCPGVRDAGPSVEHRRRRDNVAATARVLAAVPPQVPVVVASSSSVYGGSTGRPSRESDLLAPRGGYARSKVAVERLCAQRAEAGGRVTVVRPFTVVGEGQRADMAISRWLRAAERGLPLTVFGSLDRTRDLTDVRDVARVLATLVEPGRAPTGAINLGTGRPQPLSAVVAAVAHATGAEVRTEVVPAAAVEPSDTWADTRRLHQVVGFVPRTDLRDVVARQAAARPAVVVGT
jgi:nucleoside-diphosphate-sugar epimerase